MTVAEQPLIIDCNGERMVGILSRPDAEVCERAVLIIVGGPQYRVGSHRQFVLLARRLAQHGIAALRYDYRGIGDSEGGGITFETMDDDLRAAIDRLLAEVEAAREVVLWGLCDAASAALMYAHGDPRVCGVVLANPWFRSTAGEAKAQLRHYYLRRLASPAFLRQLFSGGFVLRRAWRSLREAGATLARAARGGAPGGTAGRSFHHRMMAGLQAFHGRGLLIVSGEDLTAAEFVDGVAASAQWRRIVAAADLQRRDLHGANHTFSRRAWRDQVADWTAQWVRSA